MRNVPIEASPSTVTTRATSVLSSAEIEEDDTAIGAVLIEETPDSFDPAVEGVGGEAVGAGEFGDGVERAVGEVEAVDEEPFIHGRDGGRAAGKEKLGARPTAEKKKARRPLGSPGL